MIAGVPHRPPPRLSRFELESVERPYTPLGGPRARSSVDTSAGGGAAPGGDRLFSQLFILPRPEGDGNS